MRLTLLAFALCVLTACAPVAPAQLDTPRGAARQTFAEGALYACSGVVMGMAGLMGLEINLQVQTVALGACSVYAERVAKAVWDGGVLPQDEMPYMPTLPVDPT